MNIFEYFKKKGIDTLDSSFYSKIDMWDSWYRSNVKKFHQYRIYHGASHYERCHRKSLGMAKKLCEDISDLLLNEKVKITIKDPTTDAFVKRVMEEANFTVQGNEYQERKAACGTVAYVPYLTNMVLDEDGRVVSAEVKLDYVVAKNIFPTAWENSRVTEVIFVFEKTYKRKKYAQFQHHKLEPWVGENGEDLGFQYVIENTVVLCSSGSGKELTPEEWNEIPHFEGLAARVETGSDQPQFVIDKLNIANNVDEDDSNPMGISLFANSIDVLAKIDIEYDSYANEFTMGRKRIFVAPEMLTDANGDQVFDPDDSVFYQLPEDYFKDTKEAMHEVNMSLRVQEHEDAINNDLKHHPPGPDGQRAGPGAGDRHHHRLRRLHHRRQADRKTGRPPGRGHGRHEPGGIPRQVVRGDRGDRGLQDPGPVWRDPDVINGRELQQPAG